MPWEWGAHHAAVFPFAPEITPKKRKLGKNPDVDTSFLPDRDREVKVARPQLWQGLWLREWAPVCPPPTEQPWAPLLYHLFSQEEENRLREELRQEWEAKQEKIKSEWLPGGMQGVGCLSCPQVSVQRPELPVACRGQGCLGLEAKRQFCSAGEEIEITFSYWDGSGHRRTVKVGGVGRAARSLPPPRAQPPLGSVGRSFQS